MRNSFTPPSLIAGSIPVSPSSSDHAEMVFHAAAFILDTEHIKICFGVHGDMIHYLAADANDFAAAPLFQRGDDVGTPLASLISQSEGALLVVTQTGVFAAVKHKNQLFSFSGNELALRAHIRDTYNLEALDVSGETPSLPWESLAAIEHRAAKRLHLWSGGIALSLAAVSLCIMISGSVWKQYTQQQQNISEQRVLASIQQMVAEANAPKLTAQVSLADLGLLMSKTASVCAGEPGCGIHQYQQKNNSVAWEIRVPQWVNQEFMKNLGSDLTFRREGDLLVISRGGNSL